MTTISDRESNRIAIVGAVFEQQLSCREAALKLNVSERQIYRLLVRFRFYGPEGLISLKRGRPSNHRIKDDVKAQVLSLVRERYTDFGPTLANEKILANHGLVVSTETLRSWMIAEGLWHPRKKLSIDNNRSRRRGGSLGELISIGNAYDDWFEGRRAPCSLLVFADQATGLLMNLRFSETESVADYGVATREYLNKHGRPLAFSSDRRSMARGTASQWMTMFAGALGKLSIDLVFTHDQQSKGRFGRLHKILRDRLVKEMRIQGINTIEAANSHIDLFVLDFNRRFSKPEKLLGDLHRPVLESTEELDQIFLGQ
ncbi:ISNCY family transposase [Pseudomonas sp. Xaverov 259]|uniref:ISNCY family transposase n=1 Tax=Pseudomonas sp. Xaverov 259 TaxID=2666086 RepID=UPI001C5B46B4|nr:ISNCY family transposase [Pseudomonas sp. Xaverov 259]